MTEMDLLRKEICHMREQRDMALMENAIDAKDLAYWRNLCTRLIRDKNQAIRERDEARREVCAWMNTDESGCLKAGSAETAIERGWDCFKEENHNA